MNDTQMIIERMNVGPFEVNTYIAACKKTGKGIIIDPGGEDERIRAFIKDNTITPLYIINTHGHRDHVHSNVSLSRHYSIPVCMHVEDKLFFQKRTASSLDVRLKNAYNVDIELHHNEILKVGGLKIRVIHTPGHTPGSVCLNINNCLFSGDTLFVGSAGRTDLAGGNLDTLISSIEKRILPLGKDTLIFPGHDYGNTPVSSLGREIKENIYIQDFIPAAGIVRREN